MTVLKKAEEVYKKKLFYLTKEPKNKIENPLDFIQMFRHNTTLSSTYFLSMIHPKVMLPTMLLTPKMDMRKAACWCPSPTLRA